jgi:two-component sensor histidine kinase
MYLQDFSDTAEFDLVRNLMAEANHRIANSLAVLSALVKRQAVELDDARPLSRSEVRRLLDDVRGRVDAVARLHRTLSSPAAGTSLELGGYLHDLASELVSSLSSPNAVSLHFMCELGCRLEPARALYVGLIVCELITNSLKYAHPAGVHGEIMVRCRREPAGLMIDVSDDGVGLPENFDIGCKGSSGLDLMRSLAQQIGATLVFEDGGLGFRCAIHVPADARA